MYFKAIYGDPLNERFCFVKRYTNRIRFPEVDLKRGDTVIHTGEEPLARRDFYEYVSKVSRLEVNTIVESGGEYLLRTKYINFLLNNRLEEIRLRLYSLSNPENDEKTTSGQLSRFRFIIRMLKTLKFQNISIITLANRFDEDRILRLVEYIERNSLKKLYIVISEQLDINEKLGLIRAIRERFARYQNIILINNDFEVKINSGKSELDKIEIKSDVKTKTINLVIRGWCSNRCPFCTTRIVAAAYNAPIPLDDPERIISRIKAENEKLNGAFLLEIVAVEPLEYPYILNILSSAKDTGINNIKILTNGRALKDPNLLRRFKSFGVREFVIPVSFYSPKSAEINVGDRLAYYDFIKALKNIKCLDGIRYFFNIMISRHNYTEIEKIARFLEKYGIKDYNFMLALPSIEDERFFKPYAVRLSDLMLKIAGIRDRNLQERIILSLLYSIPACIIKRYFGESMLKTIIDKCKVIPNETISAKRESARYKLAKTCRLINECPYNGICTGINEIYRRTFGDEEFDYK